MKKRKLLLTIAALLCSAGMWADVTLDITSTRLANADLSSLTGWTLDDNFNAEGNDYTDYKTDGNANVVEFYSEWDADPGDMATAKNFKIVQTITLTAGTYQLSAYGFYREKNGDGTNEKAYLKAGSNTKYINGLSAAGVDSYTGSNDLYKAANAFSLGDFNNTLEFTIDSKQSLEIGIVGTFTTQCSWCIVGPMTLKKVLEVGTEVTELIINPSFETGDKTGWTDDTSTDAKFYIQSNKNLTGLDGNYYAERWWYENSSDLNQTTATLPVGFYRITALAKDEGSTFCLYAKAGNSDEVTEPITSDIQDYNVEVYLSSADVIKYGFKGEHTHEQWAAIDNFRLTYLGNPYPDLSAAITTAEGHTLGFESGEYAPYENIPALTALANAKTINEARTATYAEVVAATSALTDASWTANVGEVNAIYDGTFSNAPVADATSGVNGWSAAVGLRQLVESNVENSIVSKGLYVWGNNVVIYGETTGYTLPLKANTVYVLTYERASWDGGSSSHTDITITDPNGTALGTAAEGGYAGDWDSTDGTLLPRSIYFATTTAGNYLFSVSPWGNTVYANMTLYKAGDGLVFADGSVPTYVPGTYPSVKITRTLTANRWATAIYPFAVSGVVSGVDNIAVLDSYDASTGALGFTSAAASTANLPFLMRSTAGTTEISLSNVVVEAASETNAVKNEAKLIGTYTSTNITNSEKNYVLSSNMIYPVGTAGATINPYRAYIQIDQSSNVKALNFFVDGDDDATGIEAIDNGQLTIDNEIYNLAGQRMSKMQKGINIVNGKKVLF